MDHDTLAAIAASDAWLSDLSQGVAPAGDPLAGALTQWLHDIGSQYQPPPSPQTHPRFRVRNTAAGAVAVLAVLAAAGTAAASPGNPVHRVLFGGHNATVRPDNAALRSAAGLLDTAERLIRHGQSQRYLPTPDRAAAIDLLTRARTLVQPLPDTAAKAVLTQRENTLTALLTSLPTSNTHPASGDTRDPSARPSLSTRPATPLSNDPATPADTDTNTEQIENGAHSPPQTYQQPTGAEETDPDNATGSAEPAATATDIPTAPTDTVEHTANQDAPS